MNFQAQRNYRWLFWILAVLGLTLDLTAKYVIFASLFTGGPWQIDRINNKEYSFGTRQLIPGKFYLDTRYEKCPTESGFLSSLWTVRGEAIPAKNEGALFGLGHGYNPLFTLVSLLAALGIIYWSTRANACKDFFLTVSLGLILAGTMGNLYDRVIFGGVRDFLHWDYLFDWPVFNLADCCLVCGASLLMFQAIVYKPSPVDEDVNPASQEATESRARACAQTPLAEVAQVK